MKKTKKKKPVVKNIQPWLLGTGIGIECDVKDKNGKLVHLLIPPPARENLKAAIEILNS